jgi:hypothetical protein
LFFVGIRRFDVLRCRLRDSNCKIAHLQSWFEHLTLPLFPWNERARICMSVSGIAFDFSR